MSKDLVIIIGFLVSGIMFAILSYGINFGADFYEKDLIKRVLEEEFIIERKVGFETYYIKVTRIKESDFKVIENGMGSKKVLK